MANALFDLTMDYVYANEDVDSFLKLELEKRATEKLFDKSKLDSTAKLMEAAAKRFVISNGTIDTGALIKGITSTSSKNQITLSVPKTVTDPRGRYYAGHIEFGFKNWKNDMFIGPFPYLRPAMRYGADLTRTDVSHDLAAIITGQRNWWRGSNVKGNYLAGQMIGTNSNNLRGMASMTSRNSTRNAWGGRSGAYRYAKIQSGHWRKWDRDDY